MYAFYAAPSSFREVSLQRTKSCPPWKSASPSAMSATLKSNFGRYGSEHQLKESDRTSMPNGSTKRELHEKSPIFPSQSLISENARLSGWQFGATPYFGASYPCPKLSFISRRYLHDLKTSSLHGVTPMATRLEQPDIFLGKPKGLSGEETSNSIGMSANTHMTRRKLGNDSELLKNQPEPKTEQFPQGQREGLRNVTMEINSAKKGPEYWERRRRNNLSAKKSRDARKFRELEMQRKLVYLKGENIRLRAEIYASQEENFRFKEILSANCDVTAQNNF